MGNLPTWVVPIYKKYAKEISSDGQDHVGRYALMNEFGLSEWRARKAIRLIKGYGGGQSGEQDKGQDDDQDLLVEWGVPKDYYYNETDDIYVVFIPSAGRQVGFPGDFIRKLFKAYSNWDGRPSTIEQTIRDIGGENTTISRPIFNDLRKIFGLTHDSAPFSPEEIRDKDTNELLQDLETQKKISLYHEMQKRKWKETEAKAKKWDNVEYEAERFLNRLEEIVSGKESYEVKTVNIVKGGKHALIVSPYDVHLGKRTHDKETGFNYSLEIAERLLEEHTSDILSTASHYDISEVIVGVGSDYSHVDNYQGTTTRGTPQDMDGTYAEMMDVGCRAIISTIDMCRQVAPTVRGFIVPGNHDYITSQWLGRYVGAWYRNVDDVDMDVGATSRKYTTYGDTLISLIHGDDLVENEKKKLKFATIIAQEARDYWGQTKHVAVFSGHLHHESVIDMGGVVFYQMPSLSPADRWHFSKMYTTARRGMVGYVIHERHGVIANIFSPVLES